MLAATIQAGLRAGPSHGYLHNFVYGAIVGIVTTFTVVSGALKAELSSGVIIILGRLQPPANIPAFSGQTQLTLISLSVSRNKMVIDGGGYSR